MSNIYRDVTLGQVTAGDIGKTIRIGGWVENIFDHGVVSFLDIPDSYAVIQVVIRNGKLLEGIRKGQAVSIAGLMEKRDAETYNPKIPTELGEKLDLLEKNAYRFCYVKGFPMFERDPQTKQIGFSCSPFSMPQGGLKALETMDPLDILVYQYDIVCNGIGLSSGALYNAL